MLQINLHLFLKACGGGAYGLECKGICGNCLDSHSCSHINGTCLNGCDPGYIGNLCKTGKHLSLKTMKLFLFYLIFHLPKANLFAFLNVYITNNLLAIKKKDINSTPHPLKIC